MSEEITNEDLAYQLGRIQSKIEKSDEFESKEADAVKYAAKRL